MDEKTMEQLLPEKEEKGLRCAFSMVLTKSLKSAWGLIALFLLGLVQEIARGDEVQSSVWLYGGFFFLLLTAAVFAWQFLIWRKTYVYLYPDELVVDKETFRSSRSSVRLSSIASVNLTQGWMERIFGTYRLQLDIDSAAAVDKTDFEMVFEKALALRIKACLSGEEKQGKEKTAFALEPGEERDDFQEEDPLSKDQRLRKRVRPGQWLEQEESGAFLYRFTFFEGLRHCFLSMPFWSIVIMLYGLYRSVLETEREAVSMAGNMLSTAALLAILFFAFYSVISPFFRYHDFVLRKEGEKLYLSYGLVTRREYTLPLDKINAVVIREPFLARIFGLCSGEVVNAGMGDSPDGLVPLFCPLVKKSQMRRILSRIAPDYLFDQALQRSPKKALIPVFLPWLLAGLVIWAAGSVFFLGWTAFFITPLLLLCGFLHYYTKGLGIHEDKISIAQGLFQKTTITIDYHKLQNLRRKSGPVSKALGLEKGQVIILSDRNHRKNFIGYYPRERFWRIWEKMLG